MKFPARRVRTTVLLAFACLLSVAADAHAAFGDRPLRRGMHGHDARVLQAWLTKVGVPTAVAPAGAPPAVVAAIAAANRITRKPYRYGGGHGRFEDSGYDCSGAVSYVLHGAGLLKRTRDSSGLMRYGEPGAGRWITVYAHGGHAYVVVAGLLFDTSMRDPDAPGPGTGPRWSRTLRTSDAFVARHPRGY